MLIITPLLPAAPNPGILLIKPSNFRNEIYNCCSSTSFDPGGSKSISHLHTETATLWSDCGHMDQRRRCHRTGYRCFGDGVLHGGCIFAVDDAFVSASLPYGPCGHLPNVVHLSRDAGMFFGLSCLGWEWWRTRLCGVVSSPPPPFALLLGAPRAASDDIHAILGKAV